MADTEGRGRGILSEADRAYLQDPDQYAEDHHRQSVHERRAAIRSRVKNAMLDFGDLVKHLPEKDLQQLFRGGTETFEIDGTEHTGDGLELNAYIPFAIAFFARGQDLEDAQVFPKQGADQPAFRDFSEDIEHGVEYWLREEKQMLADVTIEITLADAQPIENIHESIIQEAGDESAPLTQFEILLLHRLGMTDDDIETIEERRNTDNSNEESH